MNMRMVVPLAVVASAGWMTAVMTGEPDLFTPARAVRVGPGSGQIILSDVNRDKHVDIITRRLQHRELTIVLGHGTGTFADTPNQAMRLQYEPGRMAHGDVNHDSLLDLVIAARDGGTEKINVLLGNGEGGFAPAAGSPFMSSAAFELYKPEVFLVDVNEDGKLDILTANGRRNTIELMTGDGRGGFLRPSTVSLELGYDRYSFAVGDMDGDGHTDLATAASSDSAIPGHIVVLRGDGRGGFTESLGPRLTIHGDPYVASIGDLNGDKRLDLILAHREADKLSILLNQGEGRFAAHHLSIDAGMAAFHVAVADVNRDNWVDVIAATVKRRTPPDDSRIAIFLGGSRGFSPALGSPFRAGPGAYDLGVGDINNDGKTDIVASSFGGDALTVLLGQ